MGKTKKEDLDIVEIKNKFYFTKMKRKSVFIYRDKNNI